MKKIFYISLFSFLLVSCISESNKPNLLGDVFILVGQVKSNASSRTLMRLSSDCFVSEVNCHSPKKIPAFPEDYTPYNWADMYWSPNGKFMLFVDYQINVDKSRYLEDLLLYDAKSGEVKKIIRGYKYIRGITWNPNSEWAAMAIKKPDDKDMQIVLVNPNGKLKFPPIKSALDAGYPPHIFNGQVFDNNQYPVLWIDEDILFFIRERGESQTDYPDQLPAVAVRHLFTFNFSASAESEINLPVREANYELSPDGEFAYFTSYFDTPDKKNKIYNLKTHEVGLLNIAPNWRTWSPDGDWILTCDRGYAMYAITPDLSTRRKIANECPIYAVWMPDSEHVILLYFSHEDNGNIVESHFYVSSVSKGFIREVKIPDLDLRGKTVNGIYVQPVRLTE